MVRRICVVLRAREEWRRGVDVDAASVRIEQSDDKPLLEEHTSHPDRKDASNFDESVEPRTCYSKELGDSPRQSGDASSTVKFVNDLKVSDDCKPNSVEQTCNTEVIDQKQQISKLPKLADTTPTPIVFKEEEPQQKDGADSTLDVNEVAEGDDKKESSPENNVYISTSFDRPHNLCSIKRAAAFVLSAAAVKAKLLADQVEEQIWQLVSGVIEKQVFWQFYEVLQ